MTEALSPNNTAFKLEYQNRTYRRNIMHISPYVSQQVVPAQLQLYVDNTVSVGTFVAVLDSSNDRNYHIAKVIDVGEETTTLHYHATRGKRLRDCHWRPLYAQPHTNLIVMEQPDTIIRNHTLFTGDIDTRPLDDSLIILANIGMTDLMKIDARTRRILATKRQYKHHRLGHTWTP